MGAVTGIGAKLLRKMGWSEGTGLGAKRDGPVDPLQVKKRPTNLGVGAERRPFQDVWWEKMMSDAYGTASGAENDGALLEACEGRRCRPHGTAKLARLDAHDKEVSAALEHVESRKVRSKRKSKKEKKNKNKKRKASNTSVLKDGLKLKTKGIEKKRKKRRKATESEK